MYPAAVLHDQTPDLQRKITLSATTGRYHPPLFVSAQTFMIAQVR
jgi:hypothetical protein